jgi:EAL and modified HD-GYP domain-containing signal transduction protein
MPNPLVHPPLTEAPPPPSAPSRFIGRQPILNAARQVYGYELLFRSGWENSFTGNPEVAAQQMIDTTLLFGMENLVLGSKAFVNCTATALTRRLVTCFPTGTVLEILETVQVTDEVVAACKELKRLGYTIALDDFLPGSSTDRLLDLADYIKLDFQASDASQLRHIQRQLIGTNAALIAEKVETAEQFNLALNEGYHFFQGYFFARPSVLTSREVPANRVAYIQILNAINNPLSDHSQIERLVSSEASLCFRLLRYVNSAGFGARGRVSSIRQALILIGEVEFRKLVTIAAAACLGSGTNQSPELMLLCLHRARFCELIAPIAGQDTAEQYLLGLLSVLDAMLNVSMKQILPMLPLRSAAAAVLLGEPSPIELPLRLIRAYEKSQWEVCASTCSTLALTEAELTDLYLESLRWANQQIHNFAP